MSNAHLPTKPLVELSREEQLAGELAGGTYKQVPASLQEAIDYIISLELRLSELDNRASQTNNITTNNKGCKSMVHFDVAFVDCSDADSVSAEYYQIEDGWVTFKAGKGFLVASYPAGRIASIKGDPS